MLGKLLYIHGCVAPAYIFVNRLLNTLRGATGRIKLREDTKKRIELVCTILSHFNGIVLLENDKPQVEIFVDACLTGMGAYWEGNVYAVSRNFHATNGCSITQLEMLSVLISLRIFGNLWENLKVKI